MSADPNNPRAFPSSAIDDRLGGMSLWDFYAGQALVGFCSCCLDDGDPIMGADDTAKASANYADAMLDERAERMPLADDHLASAAKALLRAGHMTEADYQRTVNRIREAANG